MNFNKNFYRDRVWVKEGPSPFPADFLWFVNGIERKPRQKKKRYCSVSVLVCHRWSLPISHPFTQDKIHNIHIFKCIDEKQANKFRINLSLSISFLFQGPSLIFTNKLDIRRYPWSGMRFWKFDSFCLTFIQDGSVKF